MFFFFDNGLIGIVVPSQVLYVDDLVIFCKATIFNVYNLQSLSDKYVVISSQHINSKKSSIYSRSISIRKQKISAYFLGFSIGSIFFFIYLGIPIFTGKSKFAYLRPIFDRIKAKLATWKVYLISMASIIHLVKGVI